MKKVVVIGTGVGGSAISAILSKNGFDVSVLERNKFAGGKTASYERDGFICDMGVHSSPSGEKGPIGIAAQMVGAEIKFLSTDPIAYFFIGEKTATIPLNLVSPTSLLKMVWLSDVKFKNLFGAMLLFLKILRKQGKKTFDKYQGVSFRDFFLKHSEDKGLYGFLEAFAVLMFVMPSSESCAAEFIKSFAPFARNKATGYPKGGYRQVPLSFLDVCKKNNGTVKLDEPVQKVRIEDGNVTGVETKNGFYPADIVVSNAGIRKTIEMTGEEHFTENYLKWASKLKDSYSAVTVKYALDYQPMTELVGLSIRKNYSFDKDIEQLNNGIIPKNLMLYITCPTAVDSGVAPKGKHLLLAGTPVPDGLSSEIIEGILDRIEEQMETLYPGLEDHIIWKHRTNLEYGNLMGGRGAAEAIGLAQSVGQTGKSKPNPRMPVKGLYIVGCDAGGIGVGTEQAADSAINVSNIIINEKR